MNFLFATHVGATLSMGQLTTIVKARTGSTCHGFRQASIGRNVMLPTLGRRGTFKFALIGFRTKRLHFHDVRANFNPLLTGSG